MIQTSATMRILVAVQPVDFRKGIDGLAAVCRQQLAQDPLSGWAFVFRNCRATAVKILLYDGQGFVLVQSKMEPGRRSVTCGNGHKYGFLFSTPGIANIREMAPV